MSAKKVQNNYCLLPWKSIYVHPDGSIRPCCIQTLKFGDTKNGDCIESVWNNEIAKKFRTSFKEGHKLEGCETCFSKERMLGKSVRTSFNGYVEKTLSLSQTDLSKLDVDAPLDIVHLDLSFSNICNLKCRFCGPYNSSSWFKDADELLKLDRNFWISYLGKNHAINSQSSKDYISLVKKLVHLKKIEMKGGEPFLAREQIPFLEALIESGKSKNIELIYSTNGTVILPEVQFLFPQFQQVTISLSVDGTGDLYKYIRGENYSLEIDIEKNLKFYEQFNNVQIIIHYTLCAYNIFNVSQMIDWFNKIKNKNIVHWQIGYVINPSPLQISRLPVQIRKKALALLAHYADEPVLSGLRQVLGAPTSSDENKLWFLSFQKYVNDLDQIRKTSFLEIVPEYVEFWSMSN